VSSREPEPLDASRRTMHNEITQDASMFVAGRTPSTVRFSPAGQRATPTQSSPLPGQADVDSLEAEHDSIDNQPTLPVGTNKSRNIHTGPSTVLNPKRFKRPSKQPQVPAKKQVLKPERFVPSRKHSMRSEKRSVYDLVDSDGLSFVS
jgi:hypothetical protein